MSRKLLVRVRPHSIRSDLVMKYFLRPFYSNRAVVNYRRKYGHSVLVNRLGSLPRNSANMLTGQLEMTLVVDWVIKPQYKRKTNNLIRLGSLLELILFLAGRTNHYVPANYCFQLIVINFSELIQPISIIPPSTSNKKEHETTRNSTKHNTCREFLAEWRLRC